MNNRAQALLWLVAGTLIGANWPKIRKSSVTCWTVVSKKASAVCSNAIASLSKQKTKKKKVKPKLVKAVKVKPEPVKAKPVTVEEQILSVVQDAPKGKSLVEIAGIMGVHFVKLGAPMKKLLGESKVRKEEKLYLPA